jgi:hypothetical protein
VLDELGELTDVSDDELLSVEEDIVDVDDEEMPLWLLESEVVDELLDKLDELPVMLL